MAKFQDFFKVVAPRPGITTMTDNQNIGDQGAYSNFTWYQRLVQGSASRLTRYREYDLMDNDVEIARSLDTIAEEMIGSNPQTDMPIELVIDTDKDPNISSNMAATLKAALRYWSTLHDWDNRLFKVARVAIKYGDCFFIRHKDTQKWEYVHPKSVVAAIVDDRDMTRVMGWQMKREQKTPNSPYNQPAGHYGNYSNELVDTFPADDVIWFSLNDDMSESAPFGESVLRAVYRAQKQKELLEDAIIIYRIQRAPERRVFYVDVGNMPPQRVKTYLEQIKNEIRQKKIPTMGGGVDQVDSVYNPQQMSEDFFFAQRPDGRGSKVETLPGGCLALDTKVPLLDGRELPLSQLIDEHNDGKQNWVYSVDTSTGEVVPGIISWAGVTHDSADVITLTLDNGKSVTCTPDHQFPVWGKGYVRADQIGDDDSIIHFELTSNVLSHTPNSKHYTQVYDHQSRDWKFVHRLVRSYYDGKGEVAELGFSEPAGSHQVIHHSNINRFDNNPDNLVWMSKRDHLMLHQSLSKHASAKRQARQNADPEWKAEVYAKSGASTSKTIRHKLDSDPNYAARMRGTFTPYHDMRINTKLTFSPDMLTIIRYLFDLGNVEVVAMIDALNSTSEFVELWSTLNATIEPDSGQYVINRITEDFQPHHLDLLLKHFGYDNWKAFKSERLKLSTVIDPVSISGWTEDQVKLIKMLVTLIAQHGIAAYALAEVLELDEQLKKSFVDQYNLIVTEYRKKMKTGQIRNHHFDRFAQAVGFDSFKDLLAKKSLFNHKVVSKVSSGNIQVGTLTIDQNERYHGHHNYAISVGIFTKNSGLGQLDDLEYFQWKVFRGLRIPLSYMREGQEGSIISDGKSGVAYIAELRFAMYIKRLQGPLERVIDKEFKRYLRAAGIQYDTASFRIKLNEPENFGVYRQQQLDSDLLNTYNAADTLQFMSKRFGAKKYLQWTDEEILTNYRSRCEEIGLNPDVNQAANMMAIYGVPVEPGAGGAIAGGSAPSPMTAGGFDDSSFEPPVDQPDQTGDQLPAGNAGAQPPAAQ